MIENASATQVSLRHRFAPPKRNSEKKNISPTSGAPEWHRNCISPFPFGILAWTEFLIDLCSLKSCEGEGG
jgi:hypothetical protein